MVNHHSSEKLDVLWEETFVNLVQAFSKISKKYLSKFGSHVGQGHTKEIFQKIFDSLYFVLRLTEREIFIEALKALKVVLSSDVCLTHLVGSSGHPPDRHQEDHGPNREVSAEDIHRNRSNQNKADSATRSVFDARIFYGKL